MVLPIIPTLYIINKYYGFDLLPFLEHFFTVQRSLHKNIHWMIPITIRERKVNKEGDEGREGELS